MTLNNAVRIIGGRFRGRKLRFDAHSTIRPTLDQIRETLFNWLQPYLHNARCLDAFAGSGALGIEALSRGAKHVSFIDQNPRAIAQIKQHLTTLKIENATCLQAMMPQALLSSTIEPYDIIFLDPPFDSPFLNQSLEILASHPLLKSSGLLYVETSGNQLMTLDEKTWHLFRLKQTKTITYGLLTKNQIANNMS